MLNWIFSMFLKTLISFIEIKRKIKKFWISDKFLQEVMRNLLNIDMLSKCRLIKYVETAEER